MISSRTRATPGFFNFVDGSEVTRVPFMFNPAEVRKRGGWNWGVQEVPGRSDPHRSGGSGSGTTFNFVLELDADRGTLDRRRRNIRTFGDVDAFIGASVNAFSASSEVEDLLPALDKIDQFRFPGEKNGGVPNSYGVPRRLMINLGSVLTAEIGIDTVDIAITKYGPRLNILRAAVEIAGHVVENMNVTNRALVRRSQGLDRDRPDPDKNEQHSSAPYYEV